MESIIAGWGVGLLGGCALAVKVDGLGEVGGDTVVQAVRSRIKIEMSRLIINEKT
ncbi:MAG: hypothetical protein HZB77_02325 [Chloroflexi bacterium]|nr:hypothetical protein [Chloroflexota bacterium]